MSDINTSTVDVSPDVNLVNSLRNSNHNFKTAIADLIDNSIDADCSVIFVKTGVKNGITRLTIADDGDGMDFQTLVNALKYGWHNPENTDSLGRFGMGMKTSATSLGARFSVLTKTDSGILTKAVYDPETIIKEKAWIAHVFPTVDPLDIEQFSEFLPDEPTGTLIIIEDLNQFSSASSLCHSLDGIKKYLARIFRYFLTSNSQKDANTGKVQIFVNDKEVFGIDPLEQQASNTKLVFDDDIDLGNGDIVHVKLAQLEETDAGRNVDGDSGELNFPCKAQTWQGVYVVRGNREILAADSTVFEPVWGTRRQDKSYVRMELRYSNMDHIFKVNHDKCNINDVKQSAMDILREKLSHFISQAMTVRRNKTAAETTEENKKIHDAVEKEVAAKNKLLEFPRAKKINKIKRGNKNGTILPRNTSTKRNGNSETFTSKAGNFKIGFRDFGSSGQLFQLSWEKSVIQIDWNTSHPFYQKYMITGEKDQISAIDFMMFAIASHLTKEIQEKGDDGWMYGDNFIASVSNNLRVLSM